MSENKVQGIVHYIGDTQTFGRGFRKRVVVIEQDNGKYKNYVPLEFIKDGVDAADELRYGDKIEATYRLSGRKWQKDENSEVKWFVSVEVLSFEVVESAYQRDTEFGEPAPPVQDREIPEKNAPKPEPLQGEIPF